LLGGTFGLEFAVVGPFANLTLDPSGGIVNLAFYLVLIHIA
jgi:hypothetical protein